MSRNDFVPELLAAEIKTQPARSRGLWRRTSFDMPSALAGCVFVFVPRRADMGLRVLVWFAHLRQSRPLDRHEPLVVSVSRVNKVGVWQKDSHSVRLYHATSDRPAAAKPVMVK